MNPFDIYLVGVGGQGVLAIGEIIAEAVCRQGIPVNFYPTKGMAQRGGFVKAQLRIGRGTAGPNIPERGADLVISMELSETLKAVKFIKPGGEVLLFDYVWPTTEVMLGKAPYPRLQQVIEQILLAGGNVHHVEPATLPCFEDAPIPENVFVLGAALGHTRLGQVLDQAVVARIIGDRWKRGAQRNVFAFERGIKVRM